MSFRYTQVLRLALIDLRFVAFCASWYKSDNMSSAIKLQTEVDVYNQRTLTPYSFSNKNGCACL